MLYHTNILDQSQIHYSPYELEDRFPVCGIGIIEDPGTCDGDPEPGDDLGPPDVNSDQNNGDRKMGFERAGCGGGCSSGGSIPLMAWALAFGVAIRRRRTCDIYTN